MPRTGALDISPPVTAFVCGAVVTAAQLFAGASGPLLDAFYLHTPLDRYQVVASKAFTQTLGHLAKVGYYGILIGGVNAGGGVSVWMLGRVSDDRFRRISGYVILALGAFCFAKDALDTLG